MDVFLLILVAALPAIGLCILGVLMNRWGERHDPMGGTSDDILPIGRAERSDPRRD